MTKSSIFGIDSPISQALQTKIYFSIGTLTCDYKLTSAQIEKIEQKKLRIMQSISDESQIESKVQEWKNFIADTIIKQTN